MIKVKLTCSRGGHGFHDAAGDVVEMNDDEAARYCDASPPMGVRIPEAAPTTHSKLVTESSPLFVPEPPTGPNEVAAPPPSPVIDDDAARKKTRNNK